MAYLIPDLEALFQSENYFKQISLYLQKNGVEDLQDFLDLGFSTKIVPKEFSVILKVLSIGCNDGELRKSINFDLIKKCVHLNDDECRIYGNLVLIKAGKLADITFDLGFVELLERNITKTYGDAVLEILVYITTIGTLKELLISDFALMDKLKVLIQKPESQYAVATIFSHLATFPKKLTQEEKQVLEIQRMAKAAPPEDEFDLVEHVEKRIELLIEYGIVQELSKLKIDRIMTLVSIAEIVNAAASIKQYRGMLAQWGFCKQMISLSYSIMSKTDLPLSKDQFIVPGHALAKILISTNPEQSVHGNLALDAVKPLLFTINQTSSSLVQFECLLALTNLAGMNDEVRLRFVNLNFLQLCEGWQFVEHPMIRRASTELLCNLIAHPAVFVRYMDPNYNGIQIMTALCDDEDFETQRAASGALAILSSEQATIKIMIKQARFFEIMGNLLTSKRDELIHRGSEILKNVSLSNIEIPADLKSLAKEFASHPNPSISKNMKAIY